MQDMSFPSRCQAILPVAAFLKLSALIARMPSSTRIPFLVGLGSLINPFKQKRDKTRLAQQRLPVHRTEDSALLVEGGAPCYTLHPH